MKTIRLLIFSMFCTQLTLAWYPDYTVMATDFVLRYDFLSPARIPSISLQGLGPQFQNIYSHPLDNTFQNPAYLHFWPKNFLYADLAGEEYQPDFVQPIPIFYFDNSYYWSPYRYSEEPSIEEPLLRLVYFGKPLEDKLPMGIGAAYEYFYTQEKFYKPYWYWWGYGMMNALGGAYEQSAADPYEDYRIMEEGDNVETMTGHRLTTFVSYPITESLVLGLRYAFQIEDANGLYHDLDFNDHSSYADEYLRFYDTREEMDQTYQVNDGMAGLIFSSEGGTRLGITFGHADGFTERIHTDSDTSYYKSVYLNEDTTKTSRYRRINSYLSEKQWNYDGTSNNAAIHGDLPAGNNMLVRFSFYGEKRNANLTESETMDRSQYYFSKYWYSYYDTLQQYLSDSWAVLERNGNGNYEFKRRRYSVGVDWEISQKVRFIGGIVHDDRAAERSATEPFVGTKYSLIENEGYTWQEYDSREEMQENDKEFRWWRSESYTTTSVPLGVVLDLLDDFEIQFGLTKVLQHTDIDEGYDLVVFKDKNTVTEDGETTVTEDSMYVEGHDFPGTQTFINDLRFNAGLSLTASDHFRLTAVVTESILEPRSLRIGGQIAW